MKKPAFSEFLITKKLAWAKALIHLYLFHKNKNLLYDISFMYNMYNETLCDVTKRGK